MLGDLKIEACSSHYHVQELGRICQIQLDKASRLTQDDTG